MEFVKKPLLCDKDVMHTNDITTYGLHAQESLWEYNNIVNSKQVDFKSRHSGNGNGSERGSFARLDKKCHNCGKKGHIKKDYRLKIHGSSGNTPKKSINELPKWVNRKPVDSDTEDLITATMTRNNKKYKWCMSCNNGQGAWGFHWKFEHREWKEKQVKNNLVQFSDSATNPIIYCSYPMATSENYIKE